MPTPVSALIHAATMVTAGVYLLMRFSYVLESSANSQLIITWLGGLSALFGAANHFSPYLYYSVEYY